MVKSTSYYQTKKPYEDESYPTAPTPSTARRRIPQIPTRRATSRQSSLNNDGDYDGCRTPENSSHRGASLPPTPTATPKLLPRRANITGKPFASLPPTPGRQLPKPNLNHRSAKARRNQLLKRTSSADYADIETEDAYNSYYIRPGAASATQMYNEDYNYAYQSIDNLPAQPDEQGDLTTTANSYTTNSFATNFTANSFTTNSFTTNSYATNTYQGNSITHFDDLQTYQPPASLAQTQPTQPCTVVVSSERRTSLTKNNLDLINSQQDSSLLGYQQPPSDEYYYSAQEDRDYLDDQDEYEYEQQQAQAAAARKKRLGTRRENSPLLQQNTDSLESRDDELKDSFETAVSSISSSLQQPRRTGGYSDYTTAGDTLSTSTTSAMALPVDSPQRNAPTTVTISTTQYTRDQTEPPKAIVSVNGASVRDNVDNTNANATSTSNATANAASVVNSLGSFFSAGFSAAANAVSAVATNAKNLSAANNNTAANKTATNNRAFLKQQESIDRSGFLQQQNSIDRSGYLQQQDSFETSSYLQQQDSFDKSQYLQQQDSFDKSPYLQQQDSIDQTSSFQHQESLDQSEYYEDYEQQDSMLNDNYIKTDATDQHYFNHQESVESYTEEQELTNGGMINGYNGRGIGKESPISVIHVESYDPEAAEKEDELSELQSQQNLLDPYHPNHQRQLDPYAPPASMRRASIDPYRPVSPTRRTSSDSYQVPGSRKSSIVDNYNNSVARKSSLEPYQPDLTRRASVRHSPVQEIHKQDSVDQGSPTGSVLMDGEEPPKKNVSFEEEQEIAQPRREVTAKQRWHWAYNKIIMQLNVSRLFFIILNPT